MLPDITNRELFEQLVKLQAEVAELKASLTETSSEESPVTPKGDHLSVYIDKRLDSERKPYIVTIDGVHKHRLSMSPVRVMLVLILLLDFKDRCEGGKGIVDRRQAIRRSYERIVGEDVTDLDNTLRSALNRFDAFLSEQKLLSKGNYPLSFRFEECRFVLPGNDTPEPGKLKVSISSPLRSVNEVINELLDASPLAELRRENTLYAPAGPAGLDLVLAEIFDCDFPVAMTAVFSRPSIQNFPEWLLEKMNASGQRLRRARLVQEGYENGRVTFLEILGRNQLRKLITVGDDRKFLWYPKETTDEEVCRHLETWAQLIEKKNGYTLGLTDAVAPFHLATFRIESGSTPEFYTMFMQREELTFSSEAGCFLVGQRETYTSIFNNVVSRLDEHPTTTTEGKLVAAEIRELGARLKESGPLQQN